MNTIIRTGTPTAPAVERHGSGRPSGRSPPPPPRVLAGGGRDAGAPGSTVLAVEAAVLRFHYWRSRDADRRRHFSPRFLPAVHPPEQELSAEALPKGTPALCSGPVSRFAKPMAREEVLLDGIVPPTIVNTR